MADPTLTPEAEALIASVRARRAAQGLNVPNGGSFRDARSRDDYVLRAMRTPAAKAQWERLRAGLDYVIPKGE